VLRLPSGRGVVLQHRLAAVDWASVGTELDVRPRAAAIDPDGEECAAPPRNGRRRRFRKQVVMERLRFGAGAPPFRGPAAARFADAARGAYPPSPSPTAGRRRRSVGALPSQLAPFPRRRRRAGQVKPTPLMLVAGAGG
jgi:hypothetical protein